MPANEQRNKEMVRQIYEASLKGDAEALPNAMHADFEEIVPPILPWGGVHRGPVAFKKVLPLVAAAMDFSSIKLISLAADGDRVAALLNARAVGEEELWITEQWLLRDGKVLQLMVFYHDTTPLLAARRSK